MKPSPLNRNELAALRGMVIRAISKALPELRKVDIARAMGVDHGTVIGHLAGRRKCVPTELVVHLQPVIFAGANALSAGNLEAAAREFDRLAARIRAFAQPSPVSGLRNPVS